VLDQGFRTEHGHHHPDYLSDAVEKIAKREPTDTLVPIGIPAARGSCRRKKTRSWLWVSSPWTFKEGANSGGPLAFPGRWNRSHHESKGRKGRVSNRRVRRGQKKNPPG